MKKNPEDIAYQVLHEPDDIGDLWEIIDERKNNTECRSETSCIFYWNRFAVTEKLVVTLL